MSRCAAIDEKDSVIELLWRLDRASVGEGKKEMHVFVYFNFTLRKKGKKRFG